MRKKTIAHTPLPAPPRAKRGETTQESLTPALLLATAARLDFLATSHDRSGSTLGVLVDASTRRHLSITADGGWTLAISRYADLDPVLIYESAANVLRGGSPNPDGSISYEGDSYVVESHFDGHGWTAKLRGTT